MNDNQYNFITPLPEGSGDFSLCPELMTEEELIRFLRIPLISKSEDYVNVIENLKRMHNLPCIHICKQPLKKSKFLCNCCRAVALIELLLTE